MYPAIHYFEMTLISMRMLGLSIRQDAFQGSDLPLRLIAIWAMRDLYVNQCERLTGAPIPPR